MVADEFDVYLSLLSSSFKIVPFPENKFFQIDAVHCPYNIVELPPASITLLPPTILRSTWPMTERRHGGKLSTESRV